MATHEGKVAFITGANRGIGYETAKRLGELGITVILGVGIRVCGNSQTGH